MMVLSVVVMAVVMVMELQKDFENYDMKHNNHHLV